MSELEGMWDEAYVASIIADRDAALKQQRFWEDLADHQAKGVDLFAAKLAAMTIERDAALVQVETLKAALREAFNCITITAHHLKIQEKRRLLDDVIIAHHAEVEAKLKQVMISAPADTTSTAVRLAQPATGAPHEKQEDRG